ncbi:3-ketoacyl-CoA synthase 6 [Striga hermonthica]|uniref:3-ketoacyl-CoA synthase 6 n=1 Tax=Striga hermonthica TaxID=68872 RepID=A0A9N7MIF4_STRHE|nr:3-ketoacyl-CoA synthase 6 [Striga hermonthica]
MARPLSTDISQSVKLKYVKLGYQYLVNHFMTFFLIPLMAALAIETLRMGPEEIINLYNKLECNLLYLLCTFFFFICISTYFFMSRPRTVYLVDYALFKPPTSFRVSFAGFMEHSRMDLLSEPKSINFQMKILERSGLGEETCLPPALRYIPPSPDMASSREEAELVIFSCMDSLFKKTGLKPKDVDILILNCSLFSPTPSLTAMVINKYRMRSNIKSFNLSGMGCSAGLISVDLAKDMLQHYPNSNAVVISTEILTPNRYMGKERAMLLPNCLFRMGGAALLMSNRRAERRRAKYRLAHVVRTHKGSDEKSYRFGNTSSSSLWYELSYIESKGRMRKGDRVWQIAFGSGFKCNSAVWKCNRTIRTPVDGPWADCIDKYPVHIPQVVKL